MVIETTEKMVLWTDTVPLLIYNDCPGTIWPGIYTTSGTGPGTGGFELAAGANKSLEVSTDWYGRIWGRTNCTSSGDDSLVCTTGSCGQMDCTQASVSLLPTNQSASQLYYGMERDLEKDGISNFVPRVNPQQH